MSVENSAPHDDPDSLASYKGYYYLGGTALLYLVYFALLIYGKPPIMKLPLWVTILIFIPIYTLFTCVIGIVYFVRRWYRHNRAKRAEREKRKREKEDKENAKMARRAETKVWKLAERNSQSFSKRTARSSTSVAKMPKNVPWKFSTSPKLTKVKVMRESSSDAVVLLDVEQHERKMRLSVIDNSSAAKAVGEGFHIIDMDSIAEPRIFV